MLCHIKAVLQKTNPDLTLLFPDLYYYYDMKLVSFGYDKDFNLLLQCQVLIEPYTQKPLALYQLEEVPVPIKDTNTEANSYTWLQLKKDYLAMTEENYISLTSAELPTCKHIGNEYFFKSIFLVKHKTPQSFGSAVIFDLSPGSINDNCEFKFFSNIPPKAAILDAEDTILLSNLDKPWYLHCNEQNDVPLSIPVYD